MSQTGSPNQPQHRDSTDGFSENACPICGCDPDETVFLMPCHHQFCFYCARRWLANNDTCPLCRGNTRSFYLLDMLDNTELYVSVGFLRCVEPPAEDELEQEPEGLVGGFPPEAWADFFRKHPNECKPLLSRVSRELKWLKGKWWLVKVIEGALVRIVCQWGLHKELLVRELRCYLGEYTEPFIHRLITAAVRMCRSEMHQHQQQPHTARTQRDNSEASTSSTSRQRSTPTPQPAASSSEGSHGEVEATTSEATSRGGPDHPSSVPAPSEQDEPQEDTGRMVGGPSAQSQDNLRCWGKRRRKTRTHSLQDSPRPFKMPHHDDEEAGTSDSDPHGGHIPPQSVPSPAEQEQPQQEPEDVAGPGPSVPGPDNLPGGHKRLRKRRAPTPQDSPQPHKTPRHQDKEAGTSDSAPHGGHIPQQSLPGPSEQDEPQEDTGRMVGGPSAQSQDSLPCRGKRQRKRRTRSLQESPRPSKMSRCDDEEAGTSDSAPQGGHIPPQSLSGPSEQDEPQEDTGRMVGGPSDQSQENLRCGGKRRRKTRTHSLQDSPRPSKMPRRDNEEDVRAEDPSARGCSRSPSALE